MRTICRFAIALLALFTAPVWAQPPGGPGGPGMGMIGGMGGGMVLMSPNVQEDLKLTDEQKTKIRETAQEQFQKMRDQFQVLQDLQPAERREKMTKIMEENAAAFKKVLKEDQTKRFDQILIQAAGPMAFSQPKVQEKLKLTDDQKAKGREIMQDQMTKMGGLRDEFQNDREGAMKKMQEMRKETTKKLTGLLTEDQKKTWEEMTGKAIEINMPQMRRPQS